MIDILGINEEKIILIVEMIKNNYGYVVLKFYI